MRAPVAISLLAGVCLAHGGVFRPPPHLRPGDIFTPKRGRAATTAPEEGSPTIRPWEFWWRLNRGALTRLRERIRDRTVTSGTRTGEENEDLFDRTKLRVHVLTPIMIEALRDKEQAVRTAAAVALGKFRATEASPLLVRLFRNDSIREVRESAVIGLMLMRDPGQRETLRGIALDERASRRIRGYAVLGLGLLKDVEFLNKVLSARGVRLGGGRQAVEDLRGCAALGLGFSNSREAAVSLLAALNDPRAPRAVQGFVPGALARLRSPLALPEMMDKIAADKATEEARYGAAIAAGALVRPTDGPLIDRIGKKALRDKDLGVRALLLLSLGRIGGERAATHLVAGLRNVDHRLHSFHVLGLGLSGWNGAGDVLEEEFKKLKRPDNRAACALALALCGHKEAAPLITKEVERGHPASEAHGLLALGLLDDRESVAVVRKAVRGTNDPAVRREGAVALALLRRSAAIPELLDLLADTRSTMARGAICAALGLVGTERVVEPLLKIYRDKRRQGEERALALVALGRIADALGVNLIMQMTADVNPYVDSEAIADLMDIL